MGKPQDPKHLLYKSISFFVRVLRMENGTVWIQKWSRVNTILFFPDVKRLLNTVQ